MRSVRRRNGHYDRQARTISSFGRNRGWLRVNVSGITQRKPCFAFERAPMLGSKAQSLSRQLHRSAVRPSCAVVESFSLCQALPRCGSTSKIPERSLQVDTSGLRALERLDGRHCVRPNCSLEQTRGRGFGPGTGGSMFGINCLRSPVSLPRAAQLGC